MEHSLTSLLPVTASAEDHDSQYTDCLNLGACLVCCDAIYNVPLTRETPEAMRELHPDSVLKWLDSSDKTPAHDKNLVMSEGSSTSPAGHPQHSNDTVAKTSAVQVVTPYQSHQLGQHTQSAPKHHSSTPEPEPSISASKSTSSGVIEGSALSAKRRTKRSAGIRAQDAISRMTQKWPVPRNRSRRRRQTTTQRGYDGKTWLL